MKWNQRQKNVSIVLRTKMKRSYRQVGFACLSHLSKHPMICTHVCDEPLKSLKELSLKVDNSKIYWSGNKIRCERCSGEHLSTSGQLGRKVHCTCPGWLAGWAGFQFVTLFICKNWSNKRRFDEKARKNQKIMITQKTWVWNRWRLLSKFYRIRLPQIVYCLLVELMEK